MGKSMSIRRFTLKKVKVSSGGCQPDYSGGTATRLEALYISIKQPSTVGFRDEYSARQTAARLRQTARASLNLDYLVSETLS